MHVKYFEKISDFDLSQFNSGEEVEYLVTDYHFDII
jgi:hypothetical protein